jgi:osmotically inducible lipoprotein OsmB
LRKDIVMKRSALLIFPAILLLSACGTTKEDRAASGALIGAGTGAVVGSMVGAPVSGAAIGAATGAATGALADPDTINLGKPWWR